MEQVAGSLFKGYFQEISALSLQGRVGEWKAVKSLGLFPPKLRFGTCAVKTLPTAIMQEGLGNIAREQFWISYRLLLRIFCVWKQLVFVCYFHLLNWHQFAYLLCCQCARPVSERCTWKMCFFLWVLFKKKMNPGILKKALCQYFNSSGLGKSNGYGSNERITLKN